MTQPTHNRIFTWDFWMIFLAAGLIRISYNMQNTLMPVYMDSLGFSAKAIGLGSTISTIASLFLRPFLGGVLDRYGRRKLAIFGTALFAAATLSCGFFGALAVLLAMRGLQGAGFSAHTTAINTMAADVLPKERLSEGIGYMSLTGSVSHAIAPAIALLFVGAGKYSGGFSLSGSIGFLAVLCVLLVRAPDVRSGKASETRNLLDRMLEKKALKPTLITMILGACQSGLSTYMAVYAIGRGFDTGLISIYFTVSAVATMVARLVGGRISQRIGLKATLVVTSLLNVAGFLMIPFSRSIWGIWIAAALLGFSYGTIYPMMNAMAVTESPSDRRGTAMATFLTGMDIGVGFGAGLWGVIIDAFGIDSMFLLSAVISVILYLISHALLLPRKQA